MTFWKNEMNSFCAAKTTVCVYVFVCVRECESAYKYNVLLNS